MTTTKKLLAAVGALVLVLATITVALPFLFRGKIENRIKAAASRSIAGRVDWQSVDLSLIKSFPNLSLQLNNLDVIGVAPFAHDTLLHLPRFRLVLDLPSVVRNLRGNGPLLVRSVDVVRPRVRLIALKDGRANWDIFPKKQSKQPGTLRLDLQQLHISDGVATLHIDSVSYLPNIRWNIDAEFAADGNRYTLRKNTIRLNDLALTAQGTATTGDVTSVDFSFDAPRAEFREILSLVPSIYAHDFEKLQTSGSMSASGHVKGNVGKNVFPAFDVAFAVDKASFRYPDLPLPARDIVVRASITNPGKNLDGTTVNVEKLHVRLGDNPIDGTIVLRTPQSDPDVDVKVAGKLNLADIPRTIKLDSIKELKGTVIADASMRAKKSDVTGKRYANVAAAGTVQIQNMAVNAAELKQPLRIDNAQLRLSPQRAELVSLHGSAGSSDIAMSGSIDNLIGFVLWNDVLRGTATINSRRFVLDEWRSNDELKYVAVPGNLDFTLTASADTVKFASLPMRNGHGVIRIKDRRATLENFRLNMLGGAVAVNGFYETRDTLKPAFDVDMEFNAVDIPKAFDGLRTVQMFAPVARYAQGQLSAKMKLSGGLGRDMMPIYSALSALGSLTTNGLVLRDFPVLNKLAEVTKLDLLRDPGFMDLKSSFAIENGRLIVKPFDVRARDLSMSIAGSNGIDQSLDYTIGLKLPSRSFGTAKVSGTITKPVIKLDLKESAKEAISPEVIAFAEKQAAAIRLEGDSLAARLKREGYARADSLEAKATGLKKIPAKLAADKLRKESDNKATAIVREANAKAQGLIDEAYKKVGKTPLDSARTPE